MVALAVLAIACGAEALPPYQGPDRAYSEMAVQPADQTDAEQEYVSKLLARDPEREVIVSAFVREERLLGIVVRDNAEGQALRDLMLGLALDMAASFEHRDIEVIAYNDDDHEAIARAVYQVDTGKTIYESVR